ncbi:MAG: hypothetical protein GXY85_09645 [Candidatus Brocadiaceae bacterium]|nr:hypothetical protein [Candidatus Brocadiaceae bacterium]
MSTPVDVQASRPAHAAIQVFRDAFETFSTLAKVLVPVLLLTRILEQTGAILLLGEALSPVMGAVGLPGSMGLVWATAMLINMYGSMIVFASLAPAASLTVAQVTVLGCMILIAHGLPVELRVAQKAGSRLRAIGPLRVLAALALGWIVHRTCTAFGWLQQQSNPLLKPSAPDPSWAAWTVAQVRNLAMIFVIILTLLVLLRVLKRLHVIDILIRPLTPLLHRLGLSENATPLTIIGMTLGLTYGGGLIIRESRSGRLSGRDVFFSLALLSLSHSLIEDTLLMMAIGAHVGGVLVGRVLFSIAVVYVLARTLGRLPDETFERLLVRPAAGRTPLKAAGCPDSR